MKKYLPIKINGEWFLREENPYDYVPGMKKWTKEKSKIFEKEAIANAKPIINHDGREWYDSSELDEVWQYWHEYANKYINEENIHSFENFERYEAFISNNTGLKTRQAWKRIGEKPVEKLADLIDEAKLKVTFGLQSHQIAFIDEQLAKYDTPGILRSELFWKGIAQELSWSPLSVATYYFYHREQVERTRIIGIIEAEIKEREPFLESNVKIISDENTYRISALIDLLTKINNK